MHDASKVKLGTTGSSAREITAHDVDPATLVAGVAVSLASDGSLSTLKSAGQRIGVSLGSSLSDHKKTAVIRVGELVPMRVELKKASGVVEITSYANLVSGDDDVLTVGGVDFTAQAGAATPGDGTFQAASSNADTATSLASQINAHETASDLVVAVANGDDVEIYAKAGGADGNDIGLSYTDNDSNVGITLSGLSGGNLSGGSDDFEDVDYLALGQKAYINDLTGKVDSSDSNSTISDATFVSGVLAGIDELGAEVPCVLVDIPGGL